MSQVLNLKEASSKLRNLVQSLRSSREECEVRDEDGQTVAVVLPVELYRLYQQEWEEDFVAVDRLREKMKNNNPDYVEAQIVKAVADRRPSPQKPGFVRKHSDPVAIRFCNPL